MYEVRYDTGLVLAACCMVGALKFLIGIAHSNSYSASKFLAGRYPLSTDKHNSQTIKYGASPAILAHPCYAACPPSDLQHRPPRRPPPLHYHRTTPRVRVGAWSPNWSRGSRGGAARARDRVNPLHAAPLLIDVPGPAQPFSHRRSTASLRSRVPARPPPRPPSHPSRPFPSTA